MPLFHQKLGSFTLIYVHEHTFIYAPDKRPRVGLAISDQVQSHSLFILHHRQTGGREFNDRLGSFFGHVIYKVLVYGLEFAVVLFLFHLVVDLNGDRMSTSYDYGWLAKNVGTISDI